MYTCTVRRICFNNTAILHKSVFYTCVYVRSHHETVDTQVWLVSSVSPELEAFCPSVWPDPSEEDMTKENILQD